MVLEQLEARAHLNTVNLKGAGQHGIGGASVKGLGTVMPVPDQWLLTAGFTHVSSVRADQVGSVGEVLEEVSVVDVEFIDELVNHPKDQCGVGARSDGDPLV